ncbi:hypothetical protein Q8A67_025778 [Cirrhinus molitorella]|uniref:Uncharacterized protein n=1 Tax=Cirrhinus molitorella TaxID=172907 RepID=A0AA88NV45_9TELE|nr:hypothetical protein Q8A67_025778 [Cirrhinus molitorella]
MSREADVQPQRDPDPAFFTDRQLPDNTASMSKPKSVRTPRPSVTERNKAMMDAHFKTRISEAREPLFEDKTLRMILDVELESRRRNDQKQLYNCCQEFAPCFLPTEDRTSCLCSISRLGLAWVGQQERKTVEHIRTNDTASCESANENFRHPALMTCGLSV